MICYVELADNDSITALIARWCCTNVYGGWGHFFMSEQDLFGPALAPKYLNISNNRISLMAPLILHFWNQPNLGQKLALKWCTEDSLVKV